MAVDERLLTARVRVPEHVVVRPFADDAVALNLSTGQYHGLNGTASEMFAALRAGERGEAVATTFAERAGLPLDRVREDVSELLEALATRDLIEIDDER